MTWKEAKNEAARQEQFRDFEHANMVLGANAIINTVNMAGRILEAHYRQQITITVPAGCVVVVEEVKK